jgi:hypothetical protein
MNINQQKNKSLKWCFLVLFVIANAFMLLAKIIMNQRYLAANTNEDLRLER